MPKLNRLTNREVETAKESGVYGDGGGLHLRVQGSAKSWIFVFRHEGKRREMGLGSFPAVGLGQARRRAQDAREIVANDGDPIAARKSAKATPLFAVVADEWIDARKATVRNDKSVDRWRRALGEGGYADALRKLRVDKVTTDDVVGVLKPVWDKAATATLARGYIESVLDAAKAKGLRQGDNPARWKGHLDHILGKRPKMTRGHHAALPYADVSGFMKALGQREGVVARLLEFTVLTAARSGEASGARWEEIDLNASVWVIPAARMKAGREHRVPLSEKAVAILEALKPAEIEPEGLVFNSGGKPVSNMAAPMLMRRMKIDATVHGFRSSFRDWAGDHEDAPREIAEACLAHTLQGVEAAYRRGDALEKRRKLMKAWADYCGG